jgi:hypothetical protein
MNAVYVRYYLIKFVYYELIYFVQGFILVCRSKSETNNVNSCFTLWPADVTIVQGYEVHGVKLSVFWKTLL